LFALRLQLSFGPNRLLTISAYTDGKYTWDAGFGDGGYDGWRTKYVLSMARDWNHWGGVYVNGPDFKICLKQ